MVVIFWFICVWIFKYMQMYEQDKRYWKRKDRGRHRITDFPGEACGDRRLVLTNKDKQSNFTATVRVPGLSGQDAWSRLLYYCKLPPSRKDRQPLSRMFVVLLPNLQRPVTCGNTARNGQIPTIPVDTNQKGPKVLPA